MCMHKVSLMRSYNSTDIYVHCMKEVKKKVIKSLQQFKSSLKINLAKTTCTCYILFLSSDFSLNPIPFLFSHKFISGTILPQIKLILNCIKKKFKKGVSVQIKVYYLIFFFNEGQCVCYIQVYGVFFLSIFKTLLLHKFVEKNQFNENMLYRWEFHIVKLKNNSKRQVREKNFSVQSFQFRPEPMFTMRCEGDSVSLVFLDKTCMKVQPYVHPKDHIMQFFLQYITQCLVNREAV